jgi:hypothetical protein
LGESCGDEAGESWGEAELFVGVSDEEAVEYEFETDLLGSCM